MIRQLFALTALGFPAISAALPADQNKPQPKQKPNVILIMTDDQSFQDLGCYGSKEVYTPNLDKLAEAGVRFTRYYSGAPLSSPSRASILSGCTPQTAGLAMNATSRKGDAGMPTETVTIAEMLRDNGYATAHIGKWHIGFSPETMPNGQGFDYSIGHMGGCIDSHSHFFYWEGPNRHDLYQNGQEIWREQYFPSLMADEAEKFIEQNKNRPFFIYYASNVPHHPVQPENKWREHYSNPPQAKYEYAAFLSTLDDKLGQLFETLERNNLMDNTIIIFAADNGHVTANADNPGSGSAGIYRGCKSSLFEGGIRLPAIISWRGHTPSGAVRDQMVTGMDWLPTIAEYCGITNIPEVVEGTAITEVIGNPDATTPHDVLYWKLGVQWAVTAGDWKLIGNPLDPIDRKSLDPEKDRLFLCNLADDPSEKTNLAASNPEKLEQMKTLYLQWKHAEADDIPSDPKPIEHLAKGKPITITTPAAPQYSATGTDILVDGIIGSRSFGDNCWLGWSGKDLEATIDLQKQHPITEIEVGVMHNDDQGIYNPDYIEIFWSMDGVEYFGGTRVEVPQIKETGRITASRVVVPFENVDARYLKVNMACLKGYPEWSRYSTGPVWMFVDEIAVR